MADFSGDEEFERARELQFVRSVHAAVTVTFQRVAFGPPHEVYIVLSRELRIRGIDPDPQAVYAAAHQISEGREPAVIAPGRGRRRRETPPSGDDRALDEGLCASRRLGLPPTTR
ncbi:MAG: hypothetical protein ACRDUV_06900 [Pseudonocardiaceae bacterium]